MGITGTWSARVQQAYTGPLKQGVGINPIHASRDGGRGRVIGTRENPIPLYEDDETATIGESFTSRDIDYVCEDYVDTPYAGEDYRYQNDRPRWDKTTPDFRNEGVSQSMGEWIPWGVYNDTNGVDGFSRPGPTGGMNFHLDVSHGENHERQRAIAVPTMPVTGGWLSKVRGANALAESQDPTQPGYVFTINNASVQGPGLKQSLNERATARQTDATRSPITSRTAGMVEKVYARSFGMGGGPGTPDMRQQALTVGLRRPFFTRRPGLPPDETHFMNTMEGRVPIQRVMPSDPYVGDPETAGVDTGDSIDDQGWGY